MIGDVRTEYNDNDKNGQKDKNRNTNNKGSIVGMNTIHFNIKYMSRLTYITIYYLL